MLGLGMKSLVTVSISVIEILNQLGHIASYHTIKKLETGLTFQETESDNCTPTGMSLNLEQATDVTFNNLDRFVETLTRKNTLFVDTIGIAYQSSIQQLHPYLRNSTDTSSGGFELAVKRKKDDQEDITLKV